MKKSHADFLANPIYDFSLPCCTAQTVQLLVRPGEGCVMLYCHAQGEAEKLSDYRAIN